MTTHIPDMNRLSDQEFAGVVIDQLQSRDSFRMIATHISEVIVAGRIHDDDPIIEMVKPSQVIREQMVLGSAQRRIISYGLVNSTEAAQRRGMSVSNASDSMRKLAASGKVIRLMVEGKAQYPTFQFTRDSRIQKKVDRVNTLLEADEEPWAVASWWLDSSSIAGGKAPVDLLSSPEDMDTLDNLVEQELGIADAEL